MNLLRYILALVSMLFLAPMLILVAVIEELFDVHSLPGREVVKLLSDAIGDTALCLIEAILPEDW